MRRAVITGAGIVSCLGNDRDSVTASLRAGRSGIRYNEEYAEMGLRSRIAGWPDVDIEARVPRRARRFMAEGAAYAYIAMEDAALDAGLDPNALGDPRIGLIAGSGGGSTSTIITCADTLRARNVRKIGAFAVPKAMSSTVSACLATPFEIQGVNYSISSACSTSAHCIGNAMEQIQLGKQDVVLAGGAEEEHWSMTMLFDAMGALSSRYNDDPTSASRPYDTSRDGFVIAGGAGMVVVEELEHARRRGAPIVAELVGYGATSDGYDMVAPSGEGAVRCMRQTLDQAGESRVDCVNAHGTSTPAGDVTELTAIGQVFGSARPQISATKSMTGHSLGAAGVQEAIYSLYMLADDFVAPTINVAQPDPDIGEADVVTQPREQAGLKTVLSNSFGFGGTNASLLFRRYEDG